MLWIIAIGDVVKPYELVARGYEKGGDRVGWLLGAWLSALGVVLVIQNAYEWWPMQVIDEWGHLPDGVCRGAAIGFGALAVTSVFLVGCLVRRALSNTGQAVSVIPPGGQGDSSTPDRTSTTVHGAPLLEKVLLSQTPQPNLIASAFVESYDWLRRSLKRTRDEIRDEKIIVKAARIHHRGVLVEIHEHADIRAQRLHDVAHTNGVDQEWVDCSNTFRSVVDAIRMAVKTLGHRFRGANSPMFEAVGRLTLLIDSLDTSRRRLRARCKELGAVGPEDEDTDELSEA